MPRLNLTTILVSSQPVNQEPFFCARVTRLLRMAKMSMQAPLADWALLGSFWMLGELKDWEQVWGPAAAIGRENRPSKAGRLESARSACRQDPLGAFVCHWSS